MVLRWNMWKKNAGRKYDECWMDADTRSLAHSNSSSSLKLRGLSACKPTHSQLALLAWLPFMWKENAGRKCDECWMDADTRSLAHSNSSSSLKLRGLSACKPTHSQLALLAWLPFMETPQRVRGQRSVQI